MKLSTLPALAAVAVLSASCASTAHRTALNVMVGAEGAYNAAAKAELAICPRPQEGTPQTPKCAKGDDLRHRGLAALKRARAVYDAGLSPDLSEAAAITAQLVQLNGSH